MTNQTDNQDNRGRDDRGGQNERLVMCDHTRIYLQPECCADPEVGRLWCQDPDPEECEEGGQWTRYINVDAVKRAIKEESEEWTGDHRRAVRLALQSVWAKLDTIYT